MAPKARPQRKAKGGKGRQKKAKGPAILKMHVAHWLPALGRPATIAVPTKNAELNHVVAMLMRDKKRRDMIVKRYLNTIEPIVKVKRMIEAFSAAENDDDDKDQATVDAKIEGLIKKGILKRLTLADYNKLVAVDSKDSKQAPRNKIVWITEAGAKWISPDKHAPHYEKFSSVQRMLRRKAGAEARETDITFKAALEEVTASFEENKHWRAIDREKEDSKELSAHYVVTPLAGGDADAKKVWMTFMGHYAKLDLQERYNRIVENAEKKKGRQILSRAIGEKTPRIAEKLDATGKPVPRENLVATPAVVVSGVGKRRRRPFSYSIKRK